MQIPLLNEMAHNMLQRMDALTIKTGDRWAEKCRYILPLESGSRSPERMSFKYFPWCREILRVWEPELVFQKGAQTGITETVCINKAFFALDQLHVNVFYALPSFFPDAQDFSTARLGPAISMSPYVSNMFTHTDRANLKRTPYNSLYIRGVKSKTQIISVDTAVIIADEADRFATWAIPLLRKRSAGSVNALKSLIGVSTPSIPKYGIAQWYDDSTQEVFTFKCPHCSRYIVLKFPESLVITADRYTDPAIKDSHYICYECKHKLEQEQKQYFLATGKWVPTVSNTTVRGFHINELYSSAYQPYEVAADYLQSLRSPFYEQTFFNDGLGLPHIVDGSQLTEKDLIKALGDYRLGQLLRTRGIRTLGIDVGKDLHYSAKLWHVTQTRSMNVNDDAQGRFLEVGTVSHFLDIDRVIARVRPHMIVVDALPETRQSKTLANRYPGRCFICYFGRDARERTVNIKPDGISVSINRAAWIDQTFDHYRNGTTILPSDLPQEYKDHLKNLVRHYAIDSKGEQVVTYKTVGPDHFALSEVYNEIALNLVSQSLGAGNMEIDL